MTVEQALLQDKANVDAGTEECSYALQRDADGYIGIAIRLSKARRLNSNKKGGGERQYHSRIAGRGI